MQVLDFACVGGGVSLIVGRLVGGHGSVTGGDIDPEAGGSYGESLGANHGALGESLAARITPREIERALASGNVAAG